MFLLLCAVRKTAGTLRDLDSQGVLDVLAADARAFFGGPVRRGVQLHRQPSVPADLIQVRFDRREVHAAMAQREKDRILQRR